MNTYLIFSFILISKDVTNSKQKNGFKHLLELTSFGRLFSVEFEERLTAQFRTNMINHYEEVRQTYDSVRRCDAARC